MVNKMEVSRKNNTNVLEDKNYFRKEKFGIVIIKQVFESLLIKSLQIIW